LFTLRVTTTIYSNSLKGRRSRGRLVVGFKTTCAISAYQHYICDVESRSLQGVLDSTLLQMSNPAHCKVYSIAHYLIKFVSDLRQLGGFLQFHPSIKLTATI
jgi:hypothetical protein